MQADGVDEAELDRYAEVCARLTVRFADREAVLWRAGFDEDTWGRYEARCLGALGVEMGETGAARRERFARAFHRCRAALADPASPHSTPRSEAAETVPWITASDAPAVEERVPAVAAEPSRVRQIAVMEAMTTLASNTGKTPGPSGGKSGG